MNIENEKYLNYIDHDERLFFELLVQVQEKFM